MKKILGILSFCILACGCVFANETSKIKLVGSDIVAEKIADEVKKNLESIGVAIDISMNGSRDGLLEIESKKADLAILALPEKSTVYENMQVVPYAHQIAVVVVNTENPMEEISMGQLAQVFGSKGEKIEKWQSFGFNKNISLRNIFPLAVTPKENITLELLKNKVLSGEVVSRNVDIKFDSKKIIDSVSNTVNSIAIVSMPPNRISVKALGVSGSSVQFFKPTPENVHNGDYPMALHFYLVYDKANTKKLKPVLDVLLSDSVAEKLENGLLMPAPKNFRKSYTLGLDIGK